MESNLLKRLSQLSVLVGCYYLYDQLVAAVAAWARSVCCVSCGLEYIYIYKWIKYLLLIIMIMLFIFEKAKTLFFFFIYWIKYQIKLNPIVYKHMKHLKLDWAISEFRNNMHSTRRWKRSGIFLLWHSLSVYL